MFSDLCHNQFEMALTLWVLMKSTVGQLIHFVDIYALNSFPRAATLTKF